MAKQSTKISDLIADDKNFNKGSEFGNSLIEKSFRKFGAGRSILIDKNNRIIAGNKSVENAMAIGMEDVQIVESDGTKIIAVKRTDIDLDSEQGREMALADNASAKANIVFDAEVIEAELGEAVCVEWGIELAKEEPEAEEDDFDVPEGGMETDIVLGDLFEIGEHRLMCGDSTQTDTFEKLFTGQMADLVVTDPPYNVAYEGGTKEKLTIKNDSMDNDSFYQFLYDFYTALGSYTKAGGAWYVWHASSEIINFAKAFVDAGFLLKQQLIWVKNSMVMGRQDYQWKHEPCLYGWKEGAAHGWYSDRKQTTILNFDRPQRNAEHPTMKPIPLFAYQIGNSSKQGDIVADGFGGSGTTMVACHQMQRKGYLVEFDPKYCEVILQRMIKLDPTLKIKRNGQPYEVTIKA
jgi:site-specific DNA-methyltransferase (adenine-specific)